jgi:Mrp family chromosome partitioning ATPase
VVLAQADGQTLVVDCDLRKPDLHEMFALDDDHGLADILAERQGWQETWHEVQPNLKVVTTGPVSAGTAGLLNLRRFAESLERTRQEFDYVILDAPPILTVADAAILAA